VRRGLGANYWKLWTAASVSALGDGVRLTALPLLAAALTRDPLQVSLVTVGGSVPWLLFALISGALVDRLDRRRVMWAVDSVRAVVMGGVAFLAFTGHASIWLLVACNFLLGSGETLFDNASQALMPSLVQRDRLETANGRLYASETITLQLAGPPVGALLFALARGLPFVVDASSFAVAVLFTVAMRGTFRVARPDGPRARLRDDIGDGLRWLWGNRLIRRLAIMLGVWNLVSTATFSITVLYALEILHVGSVGYGLLFTAGALGGLASSLAAPWVIARAGRSRALIAAVLIGAVTDLGLGLVSAFPAAIALFAVAGTAGVLWNVITVSLRQSIIPEALLGRVNSVYRFIGWGTMSIGAALGGALGTVSLRAPFLISAGILLVMAISAAPVLTSTAISAARAQGDPVSTG
jgi:MFS family permease